MMFNSMKITALSFCFFLLISTAFAQKSSDFEGSWKMDYEASKALMSAEDKANYTEETEKMVKPMMLGMVYTFVKGGKFELSNNGNKVSKDDATWTVKDTVLDLNLGGRSKTFEIKEASKKKIVFYDKNEKGVFKTTVLVPAK